MCLAHNKRQLAALALFVAVVGFVQWRSVCRMHQAHRLCEAIYAEDVEEVRRLLSEGIDPRWKGPHTTPLRLARKCVDTDIVNLVEDAAKEE
jgi:hypothetical protein